jgi:hypothetical protein
MKPSRVRAHWRNASDGDMRRHLASIAAAFMRFWKLLLDVSEHERAEPVTPVGPNRSSKSEETAEYKERRKGSSGPGESTLLGPGAQ